MIRHQWNAFYAKVFLRDPLFFAFLATAVGLYALMWIFLILTFDTFRPSDSEYIILHAKIIFGTDYIARWESIFLLPALAAFLIICNTILGRAMMYTHKPLARALGFAALAGTAVLLFGLYLLYQINL